MNKLILFFLAMFAVSSFFSGWFARNVWNYYHPNFDLNYDGRVDLQDLSILESHFTKP